MRSHLLHFLATFMLPLCVGAPTMYATGSSSEEDNEKVYFRLELTTKDDTGDKKENKQDLDIHYYVVHKKWANPALLAWLGQGYGEMTLLKSDSSDSATLNLSDSNLPQDFFTSHEQHLVDEDEAIYWINKDKKRSMYTLQYNKSDGNFNKRPVVEKFFKADDLRKLVDDTKPSPQATPVPPLKTPSPVNPPQTPNPPQTSNIPQNTPPPKPIIKPNKPKPLNDLNKPQPKPIPKPVIQTNDDKGNKKILYVLFGGGCVVVLLVWWQSRGRSQDRTTPKRPSKRKRTKPRYD